MTHLKVGKSAYKSLEERINLLPMGAPPSETLYKILQLLFTEKEASLVAKLPIRPFTVKAASRIWKIDELSSRKILDQLASRAILFDIDNNGTQQYMLPPPMAGFFEFALMRVRQDIDQKLLSELFHQYLNVEEAFVKDLFFSTETRQGRVFVQEDVLIKGNVAHILDFERASKVIETSSHISVSTCYCRHKKYHLGDACDKPMEVCFSFGNTAATLIKHDYSRKIEAQEALEILHMSYENNLVQCGENVREDVSFMCNCCGCCCEALVSARKFGMLHPVETTNFIPNVNSESCIGCGKCARECPIGAIEMITKENSNGSKRITPEINTEVCLGCGICARVCFKNSIILMDRGKKIVTPVNSSHRVVMQAIEKGTLQNLIFDSQAYASHRAMAAILNVILKLPPLKQAMASKQMKSVYLEKLFKKPLQ
ncbi:MAG: 4Fe-4S binding protein [Clostridiaceae bacterium]|nr:4Fe-4S binding protein [Clostridiaceae bacterium]